MSARPLGFLGVLLLAACAATVTPDDPDAVPGPPDARRPDAEPQSVALTQSSDSATITPGNSIGCVNSATFVTRESSYYRVFTLTEHGVNGGFAVSGVTFGVEQAQAEGGGATQAATVRLYDYTGFIGGTLEPAAMALLREVPIQIASSPSPAFITVPIAGEIAAGGSFVVEVAVADSDPDTDGNGNVFFVGSNSAGQTKPPYLRAPIPGCDLVVPTQLTLIGAGFANMHMVLTVSGTPQ